MKSTHPNPLKPFIGEEERQPAKTWENHLPIFGAGKDAAIVFHDDKNTPKFLPNGLPEERTKAQGPLETKRFLRTLKLNALELGFER